MSSSAASPRKSPWPGYARSSDQLAVPSVLFNQRRFAEMDLEFDLSQGQVTGQLDVSGRRYRLEEFCDVYTRLMDDQQLPELAHVPAEAPLALIRSGKYPDWDALILDT